MLWVFLGKNFLSANLIENKFLYLKWAEKNILLALCALKNIVFVEQNNVATTCPAAKRKKNNLTPKKTIAPSPFKLNDCSLS